MPKIPKDSPDGRQENDREPLSAIARRANHSLFRLRNLIWTITDLRNSAINGDLRERGRDYLLRLLDIVDRALAEDARPSGTGPAAHRVEVLRQVAEALCEQSVGVSPIARAKIARDVCRNGDPPGLGRVRLLEWQRFVVRLATASAGRRRGEKRGKHTVDDVIFEFLTQHGLTNAQYARSMRDAANRATRRPRKT